MGRILIVFCLERINEAAHKRTLIRGIELHDPDIAEGRLTGLLLETERQPNRAQLDRLTAAAFGYAGLCERLRNLQSLAFERIRRDHVDLAYPGDPRRD